MVPQRVLDIPSQYRTAKVVELVQKLVRFKEHPIPKIDFGRVSMAVYKEWSEKQAHWMRDLGLIEVEIAQAMTAVDEAKNHNGRSADARTDPSFKEKFIPAIS